MFFEGVKKKIKTQFCCTLYKEIVFLLFFERVKKNEQENHDFIV